jgi:hypothetical protein
MWSFHFYALITCRQIPFPGDKSLYRNTGDAHFYDIAGIKKIYHYSQPMDIPNSIFYRLAMGGLNWASY